MTHHERIIDFDLPAERNRAASAIHKLRGKWRFVMCRYRARRSDQQNKWMWGHIYPMLREGINEAWGENLNDEQIHEWCKKRFLAKPIVNRKTGEVIDERPGSTAELNTSEMVEYCEQLRKFAAEYLDVNIPDPDQDYQRARAESTRGVAA